jgi:hypothetical protein
MKRNNVEVAASLCQKLWNVFTKRVSYAKLYSEMVNRKGGQIVIDHIGFRTFFTHTGEQPEGIMAIRHILECLGYRPAGKYVLPKKNLKAIHFEHKNGGLPKFYISQLDVSRLPGWAQNLLPEVLADTHYLLPDTGIELLNRLNADSLLTSEGAEVLENELVNYFRRPWKHPPKETVLKLNDVSHYAAWTLLHGNSPSHFAVLVNNQNVADWPDLETTCNALKNAGIPMKDKIEGDLGSVLRQSATLAVKESVNVRGEYGLDELTWTYAYLELIQRGFLEEDGGRNLFQGFIESQERHLYNLTRTLEN